MSGRGTISETTTLRLWLQAGGRCEYHGCNRYLLEDDLASAARCYRLALDEGAEASARPEDTWLLLAIKNARTKEKTNATAHP